MTRWNSLFDCVRQLLSHKEKLSELCVHLNITKLHLNDLEYLEDYCVLMAPIANALDFLQREENMYFGYFIATLVSLKVKIRKIYATNQLKHLEFACKELENCLLHRFEKYFKIDIESHDAIVAAITCPSVKLYFFNVLNETAPNYTVEDMKKIVLQHAEPFRTHNNSSNSNAPPVQSVNTYLDFGEIQCK